MKNCETGPTQMNFFADENIAAQIPVEIMDQICFFFTYSYPKVSFINDFWNLVRGDFVLTSKG